MDFRHIDIVPDIHGDLSRLIATLEVLGYQEQLGWAHPEGRKLVFLGDLIDRGPENLACLRLVERMIRNGQAEALMGNHELNAILYHTPDGRDGYLREHGERQTQQHESFLIEAPIGSEEAAWAISFMMQRPLFLETPWLRMVHASWGEPAMTRIRARCLAGRLRADMLEEIAASNTPFGRAVQTVTSGPAIDIDKVDPGSHFHDKAGHRRTEMRYRWWRGPCASWEDLALSLSGPFQMPSVPVEGYNGHFDIDPYDQADLPVAFGHYQRDGAPVIERANTVCLDFPQQACAYRFDGEREFDPDKLVIV